MVYMIHYKGIKIMVTGDLLEEDELKMIEYYRNKSSIMHSGNDISSESISISSDNNKDNNKDSNKRTNKNISGTKVKSENNMNRQTSSYPLICDEQDAVNTLKCDVLKIAHHGSKSSTSEDFLDAASPSIAVIQVGANNFYGHPHQQTIDRLTERGIQLYRTDLNGAVGIDIRGSKVRVVDTMRINVPD